MKPQARFVSLDFVRGMSALAVCAGHLRAALMVNYANVQTPESFHKIFYFLTGLGHQAVIVFFVLSGFFVGGAVLRASHRFDLSSYAISRLTRLWGVLIPALVLTYWVGELLENQAPQVLSGTYRDIWHSGPAPNEYSSTPLTLLGNLFFVQTILTPVYGVNSPLWSLANEFWYYAVFPLMAVALGVCGDPSKWPVRLSAGLAAMLMWWLLPSSVQAGYWIWLMGVFAYWVTQAIRPKIRYLCMAGSLSLFLLSLVYSKVPGWQAIAHLDSDFVVGVGFSLVCMVIAAWPASKNPTALQKAFCNFSLALSEISYSLYLIHFPIVLSLAGIVYQGSTMQPGLIGLSCFAGWLLVLLLLGGLTWFLFERHTPSIRAWVQGYVTRYAA